MLAWVRVRFLIATQYRDWEYSGSPTTQASMEWCSRRLATDIMAASPRECTALLKELCSYVLPQGYLPLPAPLRVSTLARKRSEYLSLVELAFARNRDGLDQQIWHQIEIDVPRTRQGVRLWMHATTQRVSGNIAFSFYALIRTFIRAWNEYCTFGRYDIPQVGMYKA